MSELLLELFGEEIPSRMQARATDDLQRLMVTALAESCLAFEHMDAFATPRRLALCVTGLPERQSDTREERKGPRVDAPEKALAGFLRGAGLDSIDQCEIREDKKGAFYVAITERKGRPTAEVLAGIIPAIILRFPWPKSMRWGSGSLRWVRPLHSIACVFGPSENNSGIIEFEVDGIKSGNLTHGHRFMAPNVIRVRHFADYEQKLEAAFVLLDADKRRTRIREQAQQLAAAHDLELVDDPALLDEVAGLVEWPVALLGRFDEDFLDLPPEVLETSMRKHQKYFALRSARTGRLANHFMVVSNLAADDGGKAIINGNERVLRARLADARFFWDQDLKTPLEDRLADLERVTFHARLGSQAERVERIRSTISDLVPYIDALDFKMAVKAAELCKSDLVTEMVGEFADLQGLIGRYYAEKQGEAPEVARAIEEHYLPQGPKDAIPTEPVSIAVALADKLDILVGFWAIDEKPTGSKDPYALRRAALGVIRIILGNKISIPFLDFFPGALQLYRNQRGDDFGKNQSDDLLTFFADRLKIYLRDKGARHDLIDAVFSLGNQDDLLMIVRRVEALGDFLDSEDGVNLLAGVKRAANILRIEEKKDKRRFDGPVDDSLLREKEETELHGAIATAIGAANAAMKNEDFAAAMTAMAGLRAPVDAFFDKVTVNADDPALRENRLNLLAQIRAATMAVADFSKISG